MNSMQPGPVSALIRDESPSGDAVLVLDAPDAENCARAKFTRVTSWSDLLCGPPPTTTVADVVWLHLPKSLAALDWYCAWLRAAADGPLHLVAGARNKHMTKTMNDVLARHFGRVWASRGRQKSRVLHACEPKPTAPYVPDTTHLDELQLDVVSYGGVFASGRLDKGTRLLARHLPKAAGTRVADLGCGTGILACLLARSGREVLAVDSSWQAVLSAQATAEANRCAVEAVQSDALVGQPSSSLDAVVCNPPFHAGTAKSSDSARAMFTTAAQALRPGGEFWCVFNSHLPWLPDLRRTIGPTEIVEQSREFIVSRSIARGHSETE